MIKMYSRTEDEIEKNLYDYKILFAYHSNKIENENIRYHDTREIFENGSVTGYTGDIKTLHEIENQVHCYEYLKPKILNKTEISVSFIKKMHYKLMRGTYDEYRYLINNKRPGEFKKHDYVTGIHEVGSSPHEIEKDMQELVDEINEYEGNDYFTVEVYLHAMFENIHGFVDGYGRLGRTLMNYYFMIHDIAPVIIYHEDKANYYEALESFDEKNDLAPLKTFLLQQQAKTWTRKQHQKPRIADVIK